MSVSALGWHGSPAAYKASKDHHPPENPPSGSAPQATTTHALAKTRRRVNQPGPPAQEMQSPYNNYNNLKLDSICINAASARSQREHAAQDAGEDGFYAGTGSSSTGLTSYGGTTFASSSLGFPQDSQKGNGKDKEPGRGGDGTNRDGSLISSSRQHGIVWACPYFIYALIFGGLCPESCHGFSRIGDVRQHIDRRHRQPPHCPSCGQTFTARQARELQTHINQRRCTQIPFQLPGVTDDQWDEIRARGRAAPHTVNGGDIERWFQIWDVLFPDAGRPSSPFIDGSVLMMRSRDLTQRFLNQGRGWFIIYELFPMATGNPVFLQGLHDFIQDAFGRYVEFVGEQEDRPNGNDQAAPP